MTTLFCATLPSLSVPSNSSINGSSQTSRLGPTTNDHLPSLPPTTQKTTQTPSLPQHHTPYSLFDKSTTVPLNQNATSSPVRISPGDFIEMTEQHLIVANYQKLNS
ncbi:6817bd35-a8ff-4f4a-acc4-d6edb4f260c8-CDS [Sclerotinia trifoliorum]|uniref:6817bd35-a8ff-4f4a-acc4-d6edb4f260c8-CDS n=1 Tax=Sclerotinia trifoliorum TaxID=28548 RepID=A0A8H2VQH7_9HELO|nr:6817bd35-a8ff-4f4a-acc4-d6edb4f260c8-CDS [Sclerotinia trifoliorum]